MQCDLCGEEFSKKDNFEVEFKFDKHTIVHNEPLAVTIDPLTIISWERETPDITRARWMKFICAAWLKLPQVLPCRWEVKKL